jgi:ABC-2 type transport system ATP-binding protein
MSRRLNFGIALLHEPRFVVLDEPTVGIDPQSRARLLDAVRALGRAGVAVLYASHYMEEVEAVCQRVGIIDHGRLLKQGTLDELLDRTRMELCILVGAVSPALATKLEGLAKLIPDSDRGTCVLVGDSREAPETARLGHLRAVLEVLEQANVPLLGIRSQEMSLETLFLSLTGRTLRD